MQGESNMLAPMSNVPPLAWKYYSPPFHSWSELHSVPLFGCNRDKAIFSHCPIVNIQFFYRCCCAIVDYSKDQEKNIWSLKQIYTTVHRDSEFKGYPDCRPYSNEARNLRQVQQ